MYAYPLEAISNNNWFSPVPQKGFLSPQQSSYACSTRLFIQDKENHIIKNDSVAQMPHKYKTELCKNWEEHGFCTYGSKCRFAHGTQELNSKERQNGKYKSRPCQAFFSTMFCPYGNRCLFKHDERKVEEINSSYYTLLNMCPEIWCKMPKRRLQAFASIIGEDETQICEGIKRQEIFINQMVDESTENSENFDSFE